MKKIFKRSRTSKRQQVPVPEEPETVEPSAQASVEPSAQAPIELSAQVEPSVQEVVETSSQGKFISSHNFSLPTSVEDPALIEDNLFTTTLVSIADEAPIDVHLDVDFEDVVEIAKEAATTVALDAEEPMMEGVQPLHSLPVTTEASSEGQSVAEDSPRSRHFFKLDSLKAIDHSINFMPPAREEDFIPADYYEDR